jgi:Sec-independent protein translocase protein TatA
VFLLFEDLGFSELVLIGIASVLFFGKRLPEVAAQAGAQIAKFRRSLQDIKQETGMDHEVRKLQRTFENVRHDLSVSELALAAKQRVEQRLSEAKERLDPNLHETTEAHQASTEDPLTGTIARGAPDPELDAAVPPPSWKVSEPGATPQVAESTPAPQDKPAA